MVGVSFIGYLLYSNRTQNRSVMFIRSYDIVREHELVRTRRKTQYSKYKDNTARPRRDITHVGEGWCPPRKDQPNEEHHQTQRNTTPPRAKKPITKATIEVLIERESVRET